jgi:hypothetical protein
LLEGGQAGAQGLGSSEAYTNLAQQALVAFVRRLRLAYTFIANGTNRPSRTKTGAYKASFVAPDGTEVHEVTDIDNLEYLRLSYPGLKEGVWHT